MSDRRQLGDRWYTVEEAGAEFIRLRQERDLAVAALRLYRDALRTAANTLNVGDPGPDWQSRALAVDKIAPALAAADAILGSMSDGP